MASLYDRAIRLLAIREHSVFELKRKLAASGSPEELDVLLSRLQADNLQSDKRYAEAYVRMRSQRGYGPKRIVMELGQRGVSSDLIQQALSAAEIDWDELEQATYQKKYGIKPIRDFKEKQKRLKYLFDRGFYINLDLD